MRHFFLLFALLISGLAQAGNNPFESKPEFLPVDKAFVLTSERLESGETQLFWQITDGYYLYQKRLKFDGLTAEQQPALPKGESHSDEFFGEQPVYRQGPGGENPGLGQRSDQGQLSGLRRCGSVLSAANPRD